MSEQNKNNEKKEEKEEDLQKYITENKLSQKEVVDLLKDYKKYQEDEKKKAEDQKKNPPAKEENKADILLKSFDEDLKKEMPDAWKEYESYDMVERVKSLRILKSQIGEMKQKMQEKKNEESNAPGNQANKGKEKPKTLLELNNASQFKKDLRANNSFLKNSQNWRGIK